MIQNAKKPHSKLTKNGQFYLQLKTMITVGESESLKLTTFSNFELVTELMQRNFQLQPKMQQPIPLPYICLCRTAVTRSFKVHVFSLNVSSVVLEVELRCLNVLRVYTLSALVIACKTNCLIFMSQIYNNSVCLCSMYIV